MKDQTATATWTYDNRDSITVTGTNDAAEAVNTAEQFLEDQLGDESENYAIQDHGQEPENGRVVYAVKCYA